MSMTLFVLTIFLTALFVGLVFGAIGYRNGRARGREEGFEEGLRRKEAIESAYDILEKHKDWVDGIVEEKENRNRAADLPPPFG